MKNEGDLNLDGKQIIVLEELVQQIMPEKNMEWMSSFADYGIDFAIKYRVLYLLDFNEKEKDK